MDDNVTTFPFTYGREGEGVNELHCCEHWPLELVKSKKEIIDGNNDEKRKTKRISRMLL